MGNKNLKFNKNNNMIFIILIIVVLFGLIIYLNNNNLENFGLFNKNKNCDDELRDFMDNLISNKSNIFDFIIVGESPLFHVMTENREKVFCTIKVKDKSNNSYLENVNKRIMKILNKHKKNSNTHNYKYEKIECKPRFLNEKVNCDYEYEIFLDFLIKIGSDFSKKYLIHTMVGFHWSDIHYNDIKESQEIIKKEINKYGGVLGGGGFWKLGR